MDKLINKKLITEAMSYPDYRKLIDNLMAESKTTGTNHSEDMLKYTNLNIQRMNRLDKKTKLSEAMKNALASINTGWTWLVLTEAWCGDAAQNLPIINQMANVNPNIELKLILRDEHPEIIDAYLTNGGKAIPKLVCLETEHLKELGTWGPRPAVPQSMIKAYKENPNESYAEVAKKMQSWYAKDKGKSIQKEFITLIEKWQSVGKETLAVR